MAKKKRNHGNLVYSPESVKDVKKRLRSFNWKRVLTLALLTLAAFSVFEALLAFEEQRAMTFSIVTAVYYSLVTLLALVIILLNRGFSKNPYTVDMIREDVPREEALAICEKVNRQKALAKKLMMVLVPFMLALLLDIIYLFYADTLKNILGFLVPSVKS